MCNFKVGQKVVCVDPKEGWLVKDEIYTCLGYDPYFTDEIQIFELGVSPNGIHYCAKASRFRPLDHQFAEDLLAEITESVMQDELLNV